MQTNSYIKHYLKDEEKQKSKKSRKIILVIIVLLVIFNPIAKIKKTIFDNAAKLKAENQNKIELSLKKEYNPPVNGKIYKEYGDLAQVGGGTKYHSGIDFCCYESQNVKVMEAGVVVKSGYDSEYGNYVEVKHETKKGTIYTVYGLLTINNTYVGQKLEKEQSIGRMIVDDPSLPVTDTILHFEIRDQEGKGNDINPKKYI